MIMILMEHFDWVSSFERDRPRPIMTCSTVGFELFWSMYIYIIVCVVDPWGLQAFESLWPCFESTETLSLLWTSTFVNQCPGAALNTWWTKFFRGFHGAAAVRGSSERFHGWLCAALDPAAPPYFKSLNSPLSHSYGHTVVHQVTYRWHGLLCAVFFCLCGLVHKGKW